MKSHFSLRAISSVSGVGLARRRALLIIYVCAAFGMLAVAQSQSKAVEPTEALRKLLLMPAPAPRTANTSGAEDRRHRLARFYDSHNTPSDDAAAADLLDYWEHWAGVTGLVPKPSDTVMQRLLVACEAEPERLLSLLKMLPDTAAVTGQMKKLYDTAQVAEPLNESWHKSVREWLLFNSAYFIDDLMAAVSRARDKDNWVDKEEALKALAKIDWSSAEPLLQTLASGGNGPRTAAMALALFHRHAITTADKDAEEKYRGRLQAIAADRNAPAHARDTAIDELSLTEWAGRDDWYVSLLADETLLEPRDGDMVFSPLTTLFTRDPDKWIPVMAKLVESKNRAIQQSAAYCLVRYTNSQPRRDAILPVLRWLSDPAWLDLKSSTDRTHFLQRMDDLEMPESVPGLIWIVENETHNGPWAARTLAHYKDARAVPALKKALARENREEYRQMILEGLLASGGLSVDEQLAALEAYAAKLATKEGREEVTRYLGLSNDPLPVAISIGRYVAHQKDAPDLLVRQVIARAESLQRTDPALARALLEVTQGWQARHVDLDLLRRIAAGTADAEMIAGALKRDEKLRANAGAELQALLGSGGAPQGIAATLLADEAAAQNILGSADQTAQIALLACARLTQMALPVAAVGPLLHHKNPLLEQAAERYLLVEDSHDAQQLLLARHPNEAFITGWRENIQMIGGDNFDAFSKIEDKLRAEMLKENAPLEIFALLSNSEHRHRVVRVYKNRAVYTYYEDGSRYRQRTLTLGELVPLRNLSASNKLTEAGPQFGFCHHDCHVSEFLSLTKPGGRRVFSHQSASAWATLWASFDTLGQGEGNAVHYYLENDIKDLEVLYSSADLKVLDVWRQGEDLRVLVEREETMEEIEQARKAEADDDEDDEAARAQRRRQRVARERARFSWRAFTGGKLDTVTTMPESHAAVSEDTVELDEEEFPSHLNDHLRQSIAGNTAILAGDLDEGGLWKKTGSGKAVRISGEGAYADPLVTADGKWAVAAKTDSDWSKPNYIVRFNLQTRRETRVNLPPADEFAAVAYLPAHGKVLLRRAKDANNSSSKSAGPAEPEFYLLDPATGQTQLVKGVFAPLEEAGRRFLQPTGRPNEYWAAIPEGEKEQTRVGRYNVKDFSFQPLLVVPHIVFESLEMWADEPAAKLYVIYKGQLLRLPFRSKP